MQTPAMTGSGRFQFFPATSTNLLRSVATRRKTQRSWTKHLLPFLDQRQAPAAGEDAAAFGGCDTTVTSGGEGCGVNNKPQMNAFVRALNDFEDRTNRWPLEDRLAQRRNSVTRFRPTLIRDVRGSLQFDRASYNRSMNVLQRIENESQLPSAVEEAKDHAPYADDVGRAFLVGAPTGDRTDVAALQRFHPRGVLGDGSPPKQEVPAPTSVSPWASALGFFQRDTIETGRQLSSDVRTRVLNVLTMAAQRRHDEFNTLAGASQYRSHPPIALFLRWWIMLSVERDVGVSVRAQPSRVFNPFSFSFSNGTALACPWSVEWTPVCKELLGKQWTVFGSASTLSPSKKANQRPPVEEAKLQTLPKTLGEGGGAKMGGGESMEKTHLMTFLPQDPTLLRELLSSSPQGAVTGSPYVNAGIVTMLTRYHLWAEALRYVCVESGANAFSQTSMSSVTEGVEQAAYEVLVGRRPHLTTDKPLLDPAPFSASIGFANPLFAPVYHGDVMRAVLPPSAELLHPWAVALQLLLSAYAVSSPGQIGTTPAGEDRIPLLVDVAAGTVSKASFRRVYDPPNEVPSEAGLDCDGVIQLDERSVVAPAFEDGRTSDSNSLVTVGPLVSFSRPHPVTLPPIATGNKTNPSALVPPSYCAAALLVAQRFGAASFTARSGYPVDAALSMSQDISTRASLSTHARSEVSEMELKLINLSATQLLQKVCKQNESLLQMLVRTSSESPTEKKEVELVLSQRKKLLSSVLARLSKTPPQQLSPFVLRQGYKAAVDVAEQHLAESLTAAATKVPSFRLPAGVVADSIIAAALFDVLPVGEQAAFGRVCSLLCGSILERYVAPLSKCCSVVEFGQLLLPVSTVNKTVRLCATYCPSFRYFADSLQKSQMSATTGMPQAKGLFAAELRRGRGKSSVSDSSEFPETVRRLIHQSVENLNVIGGEPAFGGVVVLLAFINADCKGRVSEVSSQFVLFCHSVPKSSTTSAKEAFEAAAKSATVPQLEAFGKALLASGKWKKALYVSKFLGKGSPADWQSALRLIA